MASMDQRVALVGYSVGRDANLLLLRVLFGIVLYLLIDYVFSLTIRIKCIHVRCLCMNHALCMPYV